MEFYRRPTLVDKIKYPIRFWYVYLISIIFTFQSLVVAYSSSTYMERFVSSETVGLLYSAGALVSMFFFFALPRMLQRTGNFIATLAIMFVTIASLAVIGIAPGILATVAAFVLFQALSPLTYLNIDIFSEALLGENDAGTGTKRGIALSLMSAAALGAPLAISVLVGTGNNLTQLYFISVGFGLLFMLAVIGSFRHFYDSPYEPLKIREAVVRTWKNVNLRTVTATHFLLQVFFTWAIIYIPLFLSTEINMSWGDIGMVIAAGLFAFVVCEYPIGLLADKYFGEVEMMALGFVILAISVSSIAYLGPVSVLWWMLLMFVSRVGASLVEVTTESYFFKQVHGEDASLITVFRLTRPTANLAGSLLGTLCLIFMPLNLAFVVLALILALGAFLTTALTDTK